MVFFRDSIMSDEPPIDYIVTGGVDDLVKVWEIQDDRLVLKHNLEGHSLGVVSVAVSNNGKCKTNKFLFDFGYKMLDFSMCFQFIGLKYENLGFRKRRKNC